MHTILKEKLQAYIIQNNPELMVSLQEEFSVTQYLEDRITNVMPLVLHLLEQGKPGYVIQELAMREMTTILRPSKFNYIKGVLLTEFPQSYHEFCDAGVLGFECINLIEACTEIFKTFSFSEKTLDNRFLRYAVIAKVHEYLN